MDVERSGPADLSSEKVSAQAWQLGAIDIHAGADRRDPSVRIEECFDRRLQIVPKAPSVKTFLNLRNTLENKEN